MNLSGCTRPRDCRTALLDGNGTGKTRKSQGSMPQLGPGSPAARQFGIMRFDTENGAQIACTLACLLAKRHHCFAGRQSSMPQLRPASPAAPPSGPSCAMHAHCWRPGSAPSVSAPWLPTARDRFSLQTTHLYPYDAPWPQCYFAADAF